MNWWKQFKPKACSVKLRSTNKSEALQEVIDNMVKGDMLDGSLATKALKALHGLPVSLGPLHATRSGSTIQLRYKVQGLGAQGSATLYFGKQEGLTFAERWDASRPLPPPTEGTNQVQFEARASNTPLFMRLLLTDEKGQFWTEETFVLGS